MTTPIQPKRPVIILPMPLQMQNNHRQLDKTKEANNDYLRCYFIESMILESTRNYKLANKSKVALLNTEFRLANKSKEASRHKEYYLANKSKILSKKRLKYNQAKKQQERIDKIEADFMARFIKHG